eukprot:3879563-Amphidinium_carterae.1
MGSRARERVPAQSRGLKQQAERVKQGRHPLTDRAHRLLTCILLCKVLGTETRAKPEAAELACNEGTPPLMYRRRLEA